MDEASADVAEAFRIKDERIKNEEEQAKQKAILHRQEEEKLQLLAEETANE